MEWAFIQQAALTTQHMVKAWWTRRVWAIKPNRMVHLTIATLNHQVIKWFMCLNARMINAHFYKFGKTNNTIVQMVRAKNSINNLFRSTAVRSARSTLLSTAHSVASSRTGLSNINLNAQANSQRQEILCFYLTYNELKLRPHL